MRKLFQHVRYRSSCEEPSLQTATYSLALRVIRQLGNNTNLIELGERSGIFD